MVKRSSLHSLVTLFPLSPLHLSGNEALCSFSTTLLWFSFWESFEHTYNQVVRVQHMHRFEFFLTDLLSSTSLHFQNQSLGSESHTWESWLLSSTAALLRNSPSPSTLQVVLPLHNWESSFHYSFRTLFFTTTITQLNSQLHASFFRTQMWVSAQLPLSLSAVLTTTWGWL